MIVLFKNRVWTLGINYVILHHSSNMIFLLFQNLDHTSYNFKQDV